MTDVDIENYITLKQLCEEISVSFATGRNWLKLGKIISQTDDDRGRPLFSRSYVEQLKNDIKSGKSAMLKKRRNKKYISGSKVYESYLLPGSCNIKKVKKLIELVLVKGFPLNEMEIRLILAECALQMFIQREDINGFSETNVLAEYLKKGCSLHGYEFLINDLLIEKTQIFSCLAEHPEFFSIAYQYQESEDLLGLIYISCKDSGERKSVGTYFTPTTIVNKLIQKLINGNNIEKKKILDPCCGTGNFLLQIPGSVGVEYLYGNDIDQISVLLTRINLALKYHMKDRNILYQHITVNDYLTFEKKEYFDYIIGNPPWGYEFSEEQSIQLKKKYICASAGTIEAYDLFLEQALSNLKLNGVLSFVLPEAVLNVKSHLPIRTFLMKNHSIQYLEYLGNVFDQVQCPCIILQMLRNHMPLSCIGMNVNDGRRIYTIKEERKIDKESFNFAMTDKEYKVWQKIENVPGKMTLEGKAKFALGIVTGNNKAYVTNQKTMENEMVLRGQDLRKFHFLESGRYMIYRPEVFQQAAPTGYYRASAKLLYRFVCSQLVFAYDDQQTLSLNSCNILIPELNDIDIKYILAVLNSRMAQFYFKKKFNSIKILRSHIEQIPIPVCEKEEQGYIIQLIEDLIKPSSEEDVLRDYERLDLEIANIFRLSSKEYAVIREALINENLFLY